MKAQLDCLTIVEDLPVAWCNSSIALTGVMEAVSLVTPVIEAFVIRAVATGLSENADLDTRRGCSLFMHEESNHAHMHGRFNRSLLKPLGSPPPGLAMARVLLNRLSRRLSVSRRLLVAAGFEHFSAVLAAGYLNCQAKWDIRSDTARELFALHAHEEVAHRLVVFKLGHSVGAIGPVGRFFAMLCILLAGATYVSTVVPWIVHRKTGQHTWRTFAALAGGVWHALSGRATYSALVKMFQFSDRDYCPDGRHGVSSNHT